MIGGHAPGHPVDGSRARPRRGGGHRGERRQKLTSAHQLLAFFTVPNRAESLLKERGVDEDRILATMTGKPKERIMAEQPQVRHAAAPTRGRVLLRNGLWMLAVSVAAGWVLTLGGRPLNPVEVFVIAALSVSTGIAGVTSVLLSQERGRRIFVLVLRPLVELLRAPVGTLRRLAGPEPRRRAALALTVLGLLLGVSIAWLLATTPGSLLRPTPALKALEWRPTESSTSRTKVRGSDASMVAGARTVTIPAGMLPALTPLP